MIISFNIIFNTDSGIEVFNVNVFNTKSLVSCLCQQIIYMWLRFIFQRQNDGKLGILSLSLTCRQS